MLTQQSYNTQKARSPFPASSFRSEVPLTCRRRPHDLCTRRLCLFPKKKTNNKILIFIERQVQLNELRRTFAAFIFCAIFSRTDCFVRPRFVSRTAKCPSTLISSSAQELRFNHPSTYPKDRAASSTLCQSVGSSGRWLPAFLMSRQARSQSSARSFRAAAPQPPTPPLAPPLPHREPIRAADDIATESHDCISFRKPSSSPSFWLRSVLL